MSERKRITKDELDIIIKNHQQWLMKKDRKSDDAMRANLNDTNLSGLNLSGVNLRYAYMINADLTNTNLSNADLSKTELQHSKFINSNLSKASLIQANLFETSFLHANLSDAGMFQCSAIGADFCGTNLSNADLGDATLFNAYLYNTNLENTKMPNIPYACPKSGSFIGYKGVMVSEDRKFILELEIPEDAKRSSGTGNTCRCNKAKVLRILNLDKSKADVFTVTDYRNFTSNISYSIGETVEVENFNEERWDDTSDIYFYMDFYGALSYS